MVNMYLLMFLDFLMFVILILSFSGLHPFLFSILLMIYTTLLVLKLNYSNSGYWYSYILYLLMVGGVMILILYLTSMSNNELVKFKYKFLFLMLVKVLLLGLILFLIFWGVGVMFCDLHSQSGEHISVHMSDLSVSMVKKLYLNYWVSIYLIIYLFILMVGVVLICTKMASPLRQMMKYE